MFCCCSCRDYLETGFLPFFLFLNMHLGPMGEILLLHSLYLQMSFEQNCNKTINAAVKLHIYTFNNVPKDSKSNGFTSVNEK